MWPFGGSDQRAVLDTKAEVSPPSLTAPDTVQSASDPNTKPIDQSEVEIQQLLYGITPPTQPSATPTTQASSQQTTQPTTSLAPFPDTMSCRQAFDNAWYCQSPGGQFMSVYRYGTARDCSQNWSQFWFCMRNRGRAEETKRQAIREWYAKDEEKYAKGPSSEDVWDERSKPLERAFDWDPEAVEAKGS